MLYIAYKYKEKDIHGTKETYKYQEWHVGEKVSHIFHPHILCIQADGDELEYLKQKLTGIPFYPGRIVTWYGDMARFIYCFLEQGE